MSKTRKASKVARVYDGNGCVPIDLNLSLLRELSSAQAASILTQMKQLEKHTFPSNEAMDMTKEALLKPNTSVLILHHGNIDATLVAYAIVVRWQRRLLLHKICVHSSSRRMGNGSRLLSDIIEIARRVSCSTIDLWADEARTPATKLYLKHGFQQVDRVENYYSIGRTGLKMTLELEI